MKIPKIKWIPFDSNNPPANLNPDETLLIFLREDDYNNGASWHYSVDEIIWTIFGPPKTIGLRDRG